MVPPRDSETTPLTSAELAALRALRPAFTVLMRGLDADLERGHGISHTEFLVLMSLADAAGHTLRMSDIAEFCQQSPSAISRTTGRLEGAGWVRKHQDLQDARSWNVTLTPAGLEKYGKAHASHLESVRRRFFAHMRGVDPRALGTGLWRVAEQDPRP